MYERFQCHVRPDCIDQVLLISYNNHVIGKYKLHVQVQVHLQATCTNSPCSNQDIKVTGFCFTQKF